MINNKYYYTTMYPASVIYFHILARVHASLLIWYEFNDATKEDTPSRVANIDRQPPLSSWMRIVNK